MERLLIVEDTELNIEILKNSLSNKYKLSIAKNGAQALSVLDKVKPDLILLDIMMPIMDGYETIKRIKESPAFRDIPVIFLTAQRDLAEKTKGFELGAVDYITKPFFNKEVISRIDAHLALVRSKKEVKEQLSDTVVGTTKVLLEIVAELNPKGYLISTKIKSLTNKIIKKLDVDNAWKIEVTAMLSMLGTYNIPAYVFEGIIYKDQVDPSFQKMYDDHYYVGSNLISKIPRYTDMSKILEYQYKELGSIAYDKTNTVLTGAQVLKAATYFELSKINKTSNSNILLSMKSQKKIFAPYLVEIIEQILTSVGGMDCKNVHIEDIKVGMVIYEDLKNNDGAVVLKANTVIDELVYEQMKLLFKYEIKADSVLVKEH